MKTISLAFVIFFTAATLLAQPKTNLSGNWLAKSGTPDNPGEAYFHFTHFADSLKIKVSLPMYGDKFLNMPLPAVSLKSDTIRFMTFDGIYLPEKGQISANINILYEAIPFTLSRVDEVAKPVLDTAAVSTKTPEWSFETIAPIWSSPLVVNDRLYFGSDDSCFYSLNAANGKLITKYKTGGKVRGKAVVSNKNTVFPSDDGLVYCLNAKSGKLLWKTKISDGRYLRKEPALTESNWDYTLSSPILEDQVIYIGSTDSCLYALAAKTGKVIWKFKTDHMIRATPQVYGQLVYCGNWNGKFYAIDRHTGTQVWMADLHQPILSQPAISDNRLVIGSRHAWVWCLDAQSGQEIWKYNYWWSWVESSPVIENGIVYIGSSDLKRVLAIDLQTGKTNWSFHTTGYPWATVSTDQSVLYTSSTESRYSGDVSGYLYLLNKENGTLIEKIAIAKDSTKFMNGSYGQIAVGKSMFYASTLGGKINAYKK